VLSCLIVSNSTPSFDANSPSHLTHPTRPSTPRQGPMWLPSSSRAAPKPLPPAAALAAAVRDQVAAWASARVRTESGLDAMVLAAARAEERRWVETEVEEAELLAELAETLWGELVMDAAEVLVELDAA